MPDNALVIGGGIAGSALAAQLARAGRAVTLIERKAEAHDKVCGEFISGEAAFYLGHFGIDLKSLGAVPIDEMRLYRTKEIATVSLPFPAFSLSRRVLDEALLRHATYCGAYIRRGASVRSLSNNSGRWVAELDDRSAVSAGDAFLATGKHDMRGWRRPAGAQPDMIAFKQHWRLQPHQSSAVDRCVELYLFPGGYAGLEPVEDGAVNLCLVVRRSHFQDIGGTWSLLLDALQRACPALAHRLKNAEPCRDRPLSIFAIPYGYVRTKGEGPWRLGDQAAVIPSFCGDGIAIALHSAFLAASFYLHGATVETFQVRLARDVAAQVRRATLISRTIVHPVGQAAAVAAVGLAPAILGRIAQMTRIQPQSLARVSRQQTVTS